MTASTGPSGSAPGGHVRWRRRLLIFLAAALAVAWFTRSYGLRTAEFAGGGLLIAGAAGLYLWRGPRLHKHLRGLRGGGGRNRTGGLNYPGQRGKGLLQGQRTGRKRLSIPGTGMRAGGRHRPAMAPFRRAGGAGSRAGSRRHGILGKISPAARRRSGSSPLSGRRGGARRRSGALGGARRRSGVLGGRRGLSGGSAASRRGAGRRFGASRRGAGRRFGASRRGSGTFRGFRGVSGRSRGGSPASGRRRAGSRGAPSRRRSLFRPSSWRRRPAVSGPRGRGGAGGGGRGTRPSRRSAIRRRISSWRPRRRPAGAPRPVRPPGPVRYAWWRLRGQPGTSGSRGTRNRAARNRRKAWRRHLRANPAATRHRPWYAPWRILPGGKPALRHRMSRRIRTWRWRHRLHAPRNRQGQRIGWRDRVRRRWHIWRGHPGTGTILLSARPRWQRRITARAARIAFPRRWRWLHRRRQAPPRPMPAWTGAAGQRVDHHRQYRYLRGSPPAQPQAPRPAASRPAQPAGNSSSNGSGSVPGAGRIRGGPMGNMQSIADSIEQEGGKDFDDPQDVHDSLTGAHEAVRAMQTMLQQWSEKLAESGVHPRYAEAATEAAQALSGVADELEQVTSGGVMQGPG